MPCPGHEGVPPPNLVAQLVAEGKSGSYSHSNSVPVENCHGHGLGIDDNDPTSVADKGLNHMDSPMNLIAATIEPQNCEHRVSGSPTGAVLDSVTPGLPAIQTPIPTGEESQASLVHSDCSPSVSVETGIQLRSSVGSGNFEGHLDMQFKPPSSALESMDESVGLAVMEIASFAGRVGMFNSGIDADGKLISWDAECCIRSIYGAVWSELHFEDCDCWFSLLKVGHGPVLKSYLTVGAASGCCPTAGSGEVWPFDAGWLTVGAGLFMMPVSGSDAGMRVVRWKTAAVGFLDGGWRPMWFLEPVVVFAADGFCGALLKLLAFGPVLWRGSTGFMQLAALAIVLLNDVDASVCSAADVAALRVSSHVPLGCKGRGLMYNGSSSVSPGLAPVAVVPHSLELDGSVSDSGPPNLDDPNATFDPVEPASVHNIVVNVAMALTPSHGELTLHSSNEEWRDRLPSGLDLLVPDPNLAPCQSVKPACSLLTERLHAQDSPFGDV
ncbi:hypothetical protein Nepgr_030043 [Nepenthes gracilis]|uniref:Uncharacterized protein n=1 Tax=Nepenthes gracilis TaxID=150966 RepID=A0AAD3Y5G6_NEPGR|nr:hypothetical protein Nepgr_030043 [Nepenthes gracilis]